MPDKISTSIIRNRLQVILDFQDKLTRSKNQQLVGSTQWVLTDGLSKKEVDFFEGSGKTMRHIKIHSLKDIDEKECENGNNLEILSKKVVLFTLTSGSMEVKYLNTKNILLKNTSNTFILL